MLSVGKWLRSGGLLVGVLLAWSGETRGDGLIGESTGASKVGGCPDGRCRGCVSSPADLSRAMRENPQLVRTINKLSPAKEADLKKALTSAAEEERFAAAYVIGQRRLALQTELIPLLTDDSGCVRQSARIALYLLSVQQMIASAGKQKEAARPVDFGPKTDADETAQKEAAQKWQAWWATRAVAVAER